MNQKLFGFLVSENSLNYDILFTRPMKKMKKKERNQRDVIVGKMHKLSLKLQTFVFFFIILCNLQTIIY